jgi:N-acetylglucosamine-6-phosphate deacetylase
MPDGEYLFGPADGGEPILRQGGVGIMPDGKSLASGVVGMDHCVRTCHQLTGIPLYEVIRMASLTPAAIAGVSHDMGSIAPGKLADLVVLDKELRVTATFVQGEMLRWTQASE